MFLSQNVEVGEAASKKRMDGAQYYFPGGGALN